jgi:hypothetical protein
MANIVISGDSSGSVTLSAPAVSGTTVLTLPTTSGTLVVTGGAQTIEFADGTVSAPSITNSGDTNTGIYFPAADTIAFTEGGVESMRIDADGDVGIGTNSVGANHRLEVSGNQKYFAFTGNTGSGGSANPSSSSGLFLGWNRSNGEGESNIVYGIGAGASPALQFASWNGTTYTERMRITSAGDVGIGTTAPLSRLEIRDALTATRLTVVNTANAAAGAGVNFLVLNGGTAIGNGTIRTDNADNLAFFNLGGERMRITSTGNVLLANGQMQVSAGSGDAYSARLSCAYNFPTVDTYLDSFAGASYTGQIMFRTNSGGGAMSERMRIDGNGYILIGKTAENNTAPGITLGRQESGNAPQQKMVKTFSGTVNAILNIHNGTYVGGIDFSNTATSFPTSSDIRLKTNVVDAGSASEKIDQIRIVSHGWKHDDSVVEFGVVAQELYTVAPQAVTKGDDGEKIKTAWGVDYSKLVPMLLKAHQEQQAIITQLQADVAELKGTR